MPRTLSDLIDANAPVLAGEPDYETLFKDLQCNILTPHRRRRAYFWLVEFGVDDRSAIAARYLLGQLARSHFGRVSVRTVLDNEATRNAMSEELQRIARILHADAPAQTNLETLLCIRDVTVLSEYDNYWKPQAAAAAARALTPADQEGAAAHPIHVNVLLSSAAYDKLGLANGPASSAFVQGMAARGQSGWLRDPNPVYWDSEYRDGEKAKRFDALLVVGCDPTRQSGQVDALRHLVQSHAVGFHEEIGDVIRVQPKSGPPYTVEPFGFHDGISQPVFYQSELSRGGRTSSWDPSAPLSLALCADPLGRTAFACGSYFVFRKLQQNIASFYEQSARLAALHGVDPEQLRAELVGRKRDGTPLTAAKPADLNDFDFDDDQRGAHCPFHAHIRKSNPRRDLPLVYDPRKHRIVRRAMPYGPAIDRDLKTGVPLAPADAPRNIGLLFLCAQADIAAQFEHIQGAWENNPNHPPAKLAGPDAVNGQSTGRIMINTAVQEPVTPNADYEPVVDLKGGDYFFAPSISFLRGLLDDLLAR